MPLFYNTSSPTSSNKNTINSVTVDYGIRDFLLNRNLQPFYGLSTNINGSPKIGEPVLDTEINGGANVIPIGLPLEAVEPNRYQSNISPNRFKDMDPNAPVLFDIDTVQQTQGMFGGVDFPNGIQSYPTTATADITDYGLIGKTKYAKLREKATLINLYVDPSKQIDGGELIENSPIQTPQQYTNYIDTFGPNLFGDKVADTIVDIIGGVFTNGSVLNGFDFRTALATRALNAVGLVKGTKLAQVGSEQLLFSIAANAAFHTEQYLLGGLNIQDNVMALVKDGGPIGIRSDYTITKSTEPVETYASRILGFTLPKSNLSDAGSIFLSESNTGNIQRANAMLVNTGKGQITALLQNVTSNLLGTTRYDNPSDTAFRSGFAPGFNGPNGQLALNPTLYAFYDDATKGTIYNFMLSSKDPNNQIPEICYNRSSMKKHSVDQTETLAMVIERLVILDSHGQQVMLVR